MELTNPDSAAKNFLNSPPPLQPLFSVKIVSPSLQAQKPTLFQTLLRDCARTGTEN